MREGDDGEMSGETRSRVVILAAATLVAVSVAVTAGVKAVGGLSAGTRAPSTLVTP